MKKWNCPTLTLLSADLLTSFIKVTARSIKCEKAYVR